MSLSNGWSLDTGHRPANLGLGSWDSEKPLVWYIFIRYYAQGAFGKGGEKTSKLVASCRLFCGEKTVFYIYIIFIRLKGKIRSYG